MIIKRNTWYRAWWWKEKPNGAALVWALCKSEHGLYYKLASYNSWRNCWVSEETCEHGKKIDHVIAWYLVEHPADYPQWAKRFDIPCGHQRKEPARWRVWLADKLTGERR